MCFGNLCVMFDSAGIDSMTDLTWRCAICQVGEPMTDLQLLALSGFMFVGLPAIIFCIAFAIDRLAPSRPESKNQARKHRAF